MAHQCNEDGYFVYLWLFNEITTLQKLFPLFLFFWLAARLNSSEKSVCPHSMAFNGISIMQIDELMHCLSPDKKKTFLKGFTFCLDSFFFLKIFDFVESVNVERRIFFTLFRNTEKLRLKYLKLVFNFYYNFMTKTNSF